MFQTTNQIDRERERYIDIWYKTFFKISYWIYIIWSAHTSSPPNFENPKASVPWKMPWQNVCLKCFHLPGLAMPTQPPCPLTSKSPSISGFRSMAAWRAACPAFIHQHFQCLQGLHRSFLVLCTWTCMQWGRESWWTLSRQSPAHREGFPGGWTVLSVWACAQGITRVDPRQKMLV